MTETVPVCFEVPSVEPVHGAGLLEDLANVLLNLGGVEPTPSPSLPVVPGRREPLLFAQLTTTVQCLLLPTPATTA